MTQESGSIERKYSAAELKALASSSRRYIHDNPTSISYQPCHPVHNQLRDLLISPVTGKLGLVHGKSLYGVDMSRPLPFKAMGKRLLDFPFLPNSLVEGDGLLIAAGQSSELAVRAFDGDLDSCTRSSGDQRSSPWAKADFAVGGSINNSVTIASQPGRSSSNAQDTNRNRKGYRSLGPSGSTRLYVANNDHTLSMWDVHVPATDSQSSCEDRCAAEVRLEKKASLNLRVPINYSAVSDDNRMLVAVGDTQDIYFFAIPRSANEEYVLMHTVTAASDCCFSADWSRDNSTCAIASQDGTVSLFDVRHLKTSEKANAFGSRKHARASLASFATSCQPWQNRKRSVIGAARCVKFSPGTSTELLAFSEQTSYVTIVDGRTFDPATTQRFGVPQVNVKEAVTEVSQADPLSTYWMTQEEISAHSDRHAGLRQSSGAYPGEDMLLDSVYTAPHGQLPLQVPSRGSGDSEGSNARNSRVSGRFMAPRIGTSEASKSTHSVKRLSDFFWSARAPESVYVARGSDSLTEHWWSPVLGTDGNLRIDNDSSSAPSDRARLSSIERLHRIQNRARNEAEVELCGLSWSPDGYHLYVASDHGVFGYDV